MQKRKTVTTTTTTTLGNATLVLLPGALLPGEGERSGSQGLQCVEPAARSEGPWRITANEDIWLQLGWLVEAVAIGSVLAAIVVLRSYWHPKSNAGGAMQRQDTPLAGNLYDFLWGHGTRTACLDVGILALSLSNYAVFALATEALLETSFLDARLGSALVSAHNTFECGSIAFFALIFCARIVAVQTHPHWRNFGASAWWRYLCGDIFGFLDLAAIVASLVDFIWCRPVHFNFVWLSGARGIDMLSRRGMGMQFKGLVKELEKERWVLVTLYVLGLVFWVLLSSLYYSANHSNWKTRWPAVELWDGEPWQRYESAPAAMFFVLVNLVKKNPLAHVYRSLPQRLLVVFVNIVGTSLFALLTSACSGIITILAMRSREEHRRETGADEEEEVSETDSDGESEGWFWDRVPCVVAASALGFASILAYFVHTSGRIRLLFVTMHIGNGTFALVDGLVGGIFATEWILRMCGGRGRPGYSTSLWCAVDFLAAWPGVIHLCLFACIPTANFDDGKREWLCALCIIRIFKLERALHTFRTMREVIYAYRFCLATMLSCTMFLWLTASMLMYMSEHVNPDPQMYQDYGSVVRALWIEAIHINGEWVYEDYTPAGKGICTIIALMGVGVACVPFAIITGGWCGAFLSELEEIEAEHNDMLEGGTQAHGARVPAGSFYQPPGKDRPLQNGAFMMFYAHTCRSPEEYPKKYRVARGLVIGFTIMYSLVSVVGTLDDLKWHNCAQHAPLAALWYALYCIDAASALFFSAEYLVKAVARTWRFVCSGPGICELVTLAALIFSLTSHREICFHPDYHAGGKDPMDYVDDFNVLLRLMKPLIVIDAYASSGQHLMLSVTLNIKPLLRSGYAVVTVWFTQATLLHMFEKDSTQQQYADEMVTQAERYGDVFSALQYSMVHLMGDFPLKAYSFPAKVILVLGCCFGLSTIGAFVGIFTSTFVNYMAGEQGNELKHTIESRVAATTKYAMRLQRKFRQRRAEKERAAQLAENRRKGLRSIDLPAQPVQPPRGSLTGGGDAHDAVQLRWEAWRKWLAARAQHYYRKFRRFIVATVERRGCRGKLVMALFDITLVLNVCNTLLLTVPEARHHPQIRHFVYKADEVMDLIFVMEYLLRLVAAGSLRGIFAPFRLVDLFCLIPAIFEIPSLLFGIHWHTPGGDSRLEYLMEGIMLFRIVRILKFPYFAREVVLVRRAFYDIGFQLIVPVALMFQTWVVISGLFVLVENLYDGPAKKYMSSMPAAMYWTSFFLTGEWALVDFSPGAGSRLCIVTCLFGFLIFGIPASQIQMAVQTTLHMELSQLPTYDRPEDHEPLPDESDGSKSDRSGRSRGRQSMSPEGQGSPAVPTSVTRAPGRPRRWE